MRTTAAIAPGDGAPFRIDTVELDEIRPDEALVEVVATGMCHTDLNAASGALPFPLPGVLGHEGAGRVLKIGSEVRRVSVGDAVLMSFTSCGSCRQCRSGHPAYCDHHLDWNLFDGRRPDGTSTFTGEQAEVSGHFFGQSSFARHAIADERCLVRMPHDTSDAELATFAPLGCGMQTGAGAVLNVLRPSTDVTLAVSGSGGVGFAAIMAAAAVSVETIIAIDVVDSRLELADELGASHVVNAARDNARQRLLQITGGRGVDAVIETTGNVAVLESMIECLAPAGTCFVIGAPRAGSRAGFDVNALIPGRSIRGVTLGDSDPTSFIPQLLALHRLGRFPLDRLQRRYPFEDINRAGHEAASGHAIKPVLMMKEGVDRS